MLDLKRYSFPLIGVASVVLLGVHIYYAFTLSYYSFIDDITYLGATFRILDGLPCAPIAGDICNYEHPPLSKLIMAVGFEIFGKWAEVGSGAGIDANQIGGRFFQILMGSFTAPVLYLIVNKLTGNWKTATLAAVFILVDPLYFTLSETAILDDAMVFFAFVAFLPYLYSDRLGKKQSLVLTGLFFGLSLLSKETGVFILLAMLSFVLLTGAGSHRSRLVSCLWITFVAAGTFCIGLEIFDVLFTSFPSFISQLELIISFHSNAGPSQIAYLTSISSCGAFPGLCPTNRLLVPHIFDSIIPLIPVTNGQCTACWASTNPLDWLFYMPPVVFPGNLVLAPNYLLVWTLFIWVPLGSWQLRKIFGTPDGKLVTLALLLFAWNLASNIWIYSVLGRGVFLWYFLPAVPALAMGAGFLLTRPRVPLWLTLVAAIAIVSVGIFLSPFVAPTLYNLPWPCSTC